MPRFGNPVWSPDGRSLALSDQSRDGVYVYDTIAESCVRITDSPGSGYAYHWSADGRRLGFKLLIPRENRVFPLQMPVLFDLDKRELLPLHEPVDRAGVPSFSLDGKVAFTIGEDLHILDPSGTLSATLALGHYANLAPISPDGTMAAYNDPDDQIWLIDLASGDREPLTNEDQAFFQPVWSPDSRRIVVSTVSGRLRSVDILNRRVHELDAGTTPAWSPDGDTIIYSRVERIDGVRATDASIYLIHWDGTGKRRLETEPGVHATEARPSPRGDRIAFVDLANGGLYHAPLDAKGASTRDPAGAAGIAIGPASPILGAGFSMITLDDTAAAMAFAEDLIGPLDVTLSTSVGLTRPVPYVHQVYDTPDPFDGDWACGASSALMAINYFYVLDHWDITCSWPYAHVSHYGRYVSEIYTFNGYTYNIRGRDASRNWAYGGYGYIIQNNWEDTKGHMRDYIINHGLESGVDWSPTWTKLQDEVNNDDPFVLLNSLTTAGHYIVTIGYYKDQQTAIFNDPYGNKNTPGYPSYDGQSVLYDWPGYSNGYQNLNIVHCFIYCRGNLPPTITRHPEDQSVAWGENAAFTVGAIGDGTLIYCWLKDSAPVTDGLHYGGASTPTLDVYNVTDLQAGDYRCMVSSAYGNALSDPATLTLIGPPIAPGDLDLDGDVDQVDFGLFQACLTGQSVPQNDPQCAGALLDRDTDVDMTDTNIILGCMSGAGIPADIYCAGP